MKNLKVNTSPFTGDIAGAIRIEAPEFTHLALDNIHPHIGRITIEYVPRELTLDGDSVGAYFIAFRSLILTPEEAVQKICSELTETCKPMMMNVQSNYSPRSGIATNPQARYVHPETNEKRKPSIIQSLR